MSTRKCRKCKGTGVVADLTWCGRDCCPAYLVCLPCSGTGRVDRVKS